MELQDLVIQRLKEAASFAAKNAYCPYSHFPVGAAVLTDSGEIFSGCNVENASYGLTMCAERNAVFRAVAEGHTTIRAIVVVTPTDRPTPPCGACRQVLTEFGRDSEVLSCARDGTVTQARLTQLLPDAFGPQSLP